MSDKACTEGVLINTINRPRKKIGFNLLLQLESPKIKDFLRQSIVCTCMAKPLQAFTCQKMSCNLDSLVQYQLLCCLRKWCDWKTIVSKTNNLRLVATSFMYFISLWQGVWWLITVKHLHILHGVCNWSWILCMECHLNGMEWMLWNDINYRENGITIMKMALLSWNGIHVHVTFQIGKQGKASFEHYHKYRFLELFFCNVIYMYAICTTVNILSHLLHAI